MDLALENAPASVRKALSLAGWPDRRMELVCRPAVSVAIDAQLRNLTADPGVMAGLWLYCGRFDESHAISQDLHDAEGSYWHGILHRQEPDDWNAGYWFKRVGRHPIFEELRVSAEGLGYPAASRWDAEAFIRYCSVARREGGDQELLAKEVQHIEFALLLSWCISHGRMK